MLSTMRHSWLLFALLALIALSSAFNLDQALHMDGIEEYLHHGQKRQVTGTGNAPQSTSAPPQSSEEPSSSEEPPQSTPPPPTSTPEPSEGPSSTPEPSSQPPTSGPRPSSRPNSTPTSAPPESSVTTPIVRSTPLVATSVRPITTVVTSIVNGVPTEITSTGSETYAVTTGTLLSTTLPSPQSGNGDDDAGLSDSKKKIIGGVVGGVGGAILLGGIALVCWRIWGRKKHVSEDDDDLMAGTGSALGDKPHSPNNTPFQSNLEQYHNPGGRPNAAANF